MSANFGIWFNITVGDYSDELETSFPGGESTGGLPMMGGVSGCNADMATIDELSQMLNEELVKENASAAQVSEFEKC